MVAGQSNNIACIVQARISSERLPGKIALNLCGKTILERVIEQCLSVKADMEIILATSSNAEDDITADIGKGLGIKVYRGSLTNVRERFINVGKNFKYIIRITADNPFIEPLFIEQQINEINKIEYDYVSIKNCPYGTGAQLFKYSLLRKYLLKFDDDINKEHVLNEKQLLNDNNIKIKQIIPPKAYRYPNIRLTVDFMEDYVVAHNIYTALVEKNLSVTLKNIIPIYQNLYNN